jgi:hypothetical protein
MAAHLTLRLQATRPACRYLASAVECRVRAARLSRGPLAASIHERRI